MGKKPLIISLIVVLAIAAGIVYLLNQPEAEDDSQMTRQTQNDSKEDTPQTTQPDTGATEDVPSAAAPAAPSAPAAAAPGTYVDYSDTAVANAAGTKLLFFHAPWCPQCRALEADIKSKGVPSGVTIIKVDYDSRQDLRQKYGVTIQTTVVRIDGQGNLEKRYVAYDEPTLDSVKQNLL